MKNDRIHSSCVESSSSRHSRMKFPQSGYACVSARSPASSAGLEVVSREDALYPQYNPNTTPILP